MASRLDVHQRLVDLAGPNVPVYFQAPDDVQMTYPCILYTRDRNETRHADNAPYMLNMGYMVTVIDKAAESPLLEKLLKLPMSTHDRHYKVDKLHHDTFTIYF